MTEAETGRALLESGGRGNKPRNLSSQQKLKRQDTDAPPTLLQAPPVPFTSLVSASLDSHSQLISPVVKWWAGEGTNKNPPPFSSLLSCSWPIYNYFSELYSFPTLGQIKSLPYLELTVPIQVVCRGVLRLQTRGLQTRGRRVKNGLFPALS